MLQHGGVFVSVSQCYSCGMVTGDCGLAWDCGDSLRVCVTPWFWSQLLNVTVAVL